MQIKVAWTKGGETMGECAPIHITFPDKAPRMRQVSTHSCVCRVPCAVCRVPCAVCRVPCAVLHHRLLSVRCGVGTATWWPWMRKGRHGRGGSTKTDSSA
jgi:hypothetical protein